MSVSTRFAAVAARSSRFAQPLAQAYAEANLLAAVQITRPVERVFDDFTGRDVAVDPPVVYTGPARFYPVGGAAVMGMGDEPQYFDSTQISIPLDSATPRIDDIAVCTAHRDSRMVGRAFRITGHETGSQFPVVQRMSAVGIAPSKQWAT